MPSEGVRSEHEDLSVRFRDLHQAHLQGLGRDPSAVRRDHLDERGRRWRGSCPPRLSPRIQTSQGLFGMSNVMCDTMNNIESIYKTYGIDAHSHVLSSVSYDSIPWYLRDSPAFTSLGLILIVFLGYYSVMNTIRFFNPRFGR